jgi:hypothetical protein
VRDRRSLRGPEALEDRTLLAVTVSAMGDSMTAPYAGTAQGSAGDRNWVEQFQLLRSPDDVTIYNEARGGATSTSLLSQGQHTRTAARVADGTVDSAHGRDIDGLRLSDQEVLDLAGIDHPPGESYIDVSGYVIFDPGPSPSAGAGFGTAVAVARPTPQGSPSDLFPDRPGSPAPVTTPSRVVGDSPGAPAHPPRPPGPSQAVASTGVRPRVPAAVAGTFDHALRDALTPTDFP